MVSILCVACQEPTEFKIDGDYKNHLKTFHNAASTQEAIANERMKKQNLPANLPPGIPAEALPNKDFIEAVQRIETKKNQPVAPPVPQTPAGTDKPILLKYRFEGTCPKCHNPVKTIIVDTKGKLFANAYCMFDDEVLDQIKVNLIYPKVKGKEEHGNNGGQKNVSRKQKM